MEETFVSIITNPAGSVHAAITTPQMIMLMTQASTPEARCKLVLNRLQTADETSATDLLMQTMGLSLSSMIPPDTMETFAESLIEFAKDKTEWVEAMRWVAAIIHYHATDEITVSMFAEFGAVEFALKLIETYHSDPLTVAAGAALIGHFHCFFLGNAVPLLTKSLENLCANKLVCRVIAKVLAEFTSYNGSSSVKWMQNTCNEFLNSNGPTRLEQMFEMHSNDEDIILFSCRIVANLSSLAPDGYIETTSIMARVTDALRQSHATNPALAGHALYALSNYPDDADIELLGDILETCKNEHTLHEAVRCASSIATHVKAVKPKMTQFNIVGRVMDIMMKYNRNVSIMEEGCNLISYMTFDSTATTNSITASGGINLILTAMKQFSTNLTFLTAACAALSGITFNNAEGQEQVLQGNGMTLILEAMSKNHTVRLHEMGALALGTMCWNMSLKDHVVENNGIKILLDSLREFRDSGSLVKNACRAIAQISFNSDKYRELISNTPDAAKTIIDAMRQHPTHDRAQMHSCVALSYLNWQSKCQEEHVRPGHRVIIDAMKNHLQSSDVLEHACRALANIGSALPPAEAKESLIQIVDASRRHEKVADVQEEACRAMVTLSLQCPANKDVLSSLEAPLRVSQALRNFPKSYSVQQEACNALAHLAYEHQDLNRTVTELGGVSLLLTAMRNHSTNSRVQLTACGGLSALAFDNTVAQRQIYDQGGVDLVIAAMRAYPRLRIMELSCSVLGTLAWNTDIKENVAVMAIPEILDAMVTHSESPLLQKATCRAISQFAFNSEKNRKFLFEKGAVPLICKAISNQIYMKTEKLITHALVALTYMCWENGTVAEAIVNEGADELLANVCKEYQHNDKIYNKAQHLMKILARKSATGTSKNSIKSPPAASPVGADDLMFPVVIGGASTIPPDQQDTTPVTTEVVCHMTPTMFDRSDFEEAKNSFYSAPQDHERPKSPVKDYRSTIQRGNRNNADGDTPYVDPAVISASSGVTYAEDLPYERNQKNRSNNGGNGCRRNVLNLLNKSKNNDTNNNNTTTNNNSNQSRRITNPDDLWDDPVSNGRGNGTAGQRSHESLNWQQKELQQQLSGGGGYRSGRRGGENRGNRRGGRGRGGGHKNDSGFTVKSN
eukprot:Tbor_TRINITY_DN5621_c2_g3::TRINITY_DN5621_c2_g3_i1::g.8327::m.8327